MREKEEMSDRESLGDDLFMLSMRQQWHGVVNIYKESRNSHRMKLTKSEDTAFHIAISSYSPNNSQFRLHEHELCAKNMISLMKHQGSLADVVRMRNVRGDTPLHLAAAVGWESICMLIAADDPELIAIRNMDGETPLFLAAHHGNLETFSSLHRIYNAGNERPDGSLCRRRDGNTVLHSAISGQHFGLAYFILEHYRNLLDYVNVMGETPLHVLARKPNLFKSSSQLGFYESIIYQCLFVDDDANLKKQHKHNGRKLPENCWTCVNIFFLLWNPIYKSYKAGLSRSNKQKSNPPYVEHGVPINETFLAGCSISRKPNANPSNDDGENQNKAAEEKSKYNGYFPPNYTTCISIFKFAAKVILIVLGVGFFKIREIHDKKVENFRAMEIMNKMVEFESSYKYDSNGQRPTIEIAEAFRILDSPPSDEDHETNMKLNSSAKYQQKNGNDKKDETESGDDKSKSVVKDTPLLVAAKMGIPEMVKKILNTFPLAIKDEDSEGKNVVMVAAENRQTSVFDFLMQKNLPDYVFHHFDKQGNNILHLAAKWGEKPWSVPGAALQLQWEIKWYNYVKESVPPQFFSNSNAEGETPGEIFTRTHECLVKSGTEWLIKTCEYCTVVAALIATVAFSTSATVPGGLDQNSGYPILKDHKGFDIFSFASLIGLCQSITALILFFAIMISRFDERNFERDLPRKLLLGMTCLISSIAAMIVSFCAGHSFILRDKLRFGAVPIYAVAMIPIAFFTVAQLPLYFNLLYASR